MKTYDMVFKEGQLVDVRHHEIIQADLAISEGRIAEIGSDLHGKEEIDCAGKYISPGFIDSHVHIESGMATPLEFAKTVMPQGTTTIIADPHELVNVKGNLAMDYLLKATEDLPLSVYVMLPSCVPTTSFETAGAEFGIEDMKQWVSHPRVLGLGEVMCYPSVLSRDPVIMDKIALCEGMVIDGHCPGLTGKDLASYVAAGIMTDHESTSYKEAKEKCDAGLKILIREGSAARNLQVIVEGLVKEHANDAYLSQFMFCTDDKHLETIENEGHISYNVMKGISLGLDPIQAYAMATCNAADTYGLGEVGDLSVGKRADLVLLDSLEDVIIDRVYSAGQLVTRDLFPTKSAPIKEEMTHSVHVKPFSSSKLRIRVEGKTPVIGMSPGQIVTTFLREEVPEKDGYFCPDAEYNKLCVIERHHATGNVAVAPIKGYGIQGGAIATTVAHDSHNIIVAGDNDEDIMMAVETIKEIQGGYVIVSKGEVLGTLPLQVAGLLSLRPKEQVIQDIHQMLSIARKLGVPKGIDPFITLSFMALSVIPELRLTDQGLFDVLSFQQL